MSTPTSRLMTAVRITNEHGLGYQPEDAWENEMLQVLRTTNDVILISSHDGYRVPDIEVTPRPEPPTPEEIADRVLAAHPSSAAQLIENAGRALIIEAVIEARKNHVRI